MRRTITLVIIMAFALHGTASASQWTRSASADRLTGEKIIRFTNKGSGAIRQFGRNVSATMVIGCINAFQDRNAHRAADEYSAVIHFSERVGIADAGFRYRFDQDPVHSITAELSERGDILYASWPKSVDSTFITGLRRSRKLRAEIDLAWAGVVLLEFNTAGADQAMNSIPCGEGSAAH